MSTRSRTNLLNMEESYLGGGEGVDNPAAVTPGGQYGTIQDRFKPCLKEAEKHKRKKNMKHGAIIAIVILVCALMAFGGSMLAVHVLDRDENGEPVEKVQSNQQSLSLGNHAPSNRAVCAPGANKTQKVYPNLDYSVFGYNILGAYPMAFGHDPGFTHPIFLVSYAGNHKTADCSYSIPDGIDVVRDISCATTFNSETMQTKQEFDKALSHSAGASFGGFGVHFSANVDYKTQSSQISTGKHVFVLTQAKCQQFFSQINEFNPPPFHQSFIGWMIKLNNTDIMRDYLDFISYYGTHYIAEAAFGARFVNFFSMTTDTYSSMKSKSINVNVQASYHALFFSVGAHYSFSDNEKQTMSKFYNSVSTKTVTMGTPPPKDLNATKWANQAFDTPVPISYKLAPIDQLFTDKFMGNLPAGINIDYNMIRKNLMHVINIQYPKEIYDRSTNIPCRMVNSAYKLPSNVCFKQNLMQVSAAVESKADCQSNCLEARDCLGATFGSQCHVLYRLSYAQKTGMEVEQAENNAECNSYVFPYRLSSNYGRSDQPEWLWLKGVIALEHQGTWSSGSINPAECESRCVKDLTCVAVSIKADNKCGLFTDTQIQMATLDVSNTAGDKVGFVKVC